MLDDRNETVSAQQIGSVGIWDRTSSETGWTALLGDQRPQPTCRSMQRRRATDLSDLPPTYIGLGAEVFVTRPPSQRDLGGGRQCRAHIWAGGFHGFQTIIADGSGVADSRADARVLGTPRVGAVTGA
jgi:hypothetical protein